jgi:hypothetical protein
MPPTLEEALKDAALATFAAAVRRAVGGGGDDGGGKLLLAVDVAHHVIFEVLAFGAGGPEFYAQLHIARLVALHTRKGDVAAVRRQLGVTEDGGSSGGPPTTVVIVVPPLTTVAKLIAEALRPLEALSSPDKPAAAVLWLPAATSECSLEMERQGVAGFVRQANLPLGLVPVDRSVAALCHDSVFGELYVKGDSRALSEVVKSVLAIEKHTGRSILDVTCHGFFAQHVKKMLELAHRQQQRLKMRRSAANTQPTTTGATCGPPIDKLIVIDRMEDPLSMLLTPMTYEGLLDALVGVNHGVVTYQKEEAVKMPDLRKGDSGEIADINLSSSSSSVSSSTIASPPAATTSEKVILNHLDELYNEIRDVNFNILISRVLVGIAQDLAIEVRGSKASVASSGERSSNALPPSGQPRRETFLKVKELLKKVPNLVKKKRSLAHHLQLVNQIRQLSTQFALRGCVETEMMIMSAGKSASSTDAKDVDRFLEEAILRDPPLNLYDVTKLLCLCSLVRGGMKQDKLVWYRQQLCHTYGHQVLPLLTQLEKLDLLSVENKFDFPTNRKNLALMRGILDDEDTQNPTDIHFMFPYTGYAPMSVRLVQNTLGMKYKTLGKDPTSSMLSIGSASSGGDIANKLAAKSSTGSLYGPDSAEKKPINVLVYYVGGVTVAELTAFRFLNQKQSEFAFFVAGTSVCNGNRILRAIY